MVKMVTYNVNGLRPRVAQHGSLRRLLDALDADIICFQETKLSRQDLSGDSIMAEGYEAFVHATVLPKGAEHTLALPRFVEYHQHFLARRSLCQ